MPTSIPPVPIQRDHKGVRRARRLSLAALALLLLCFAAGAGFSYVVTTKVEEGIEQNLARETRNGRKLTCATREFFGFPFRVAMRCDAPRLEIERPSGKIVLSAARLTGVAQIYDLNHVIVEAQGPLSLAAPGLSETEADWGSLLASLVVQGGGVDHADMAMESPSLRVRDGQNMIATQAERFEIHARRDPARSPEDGAVEISSRLTRLASPVLDGLMGEASPVDGSADVSISKADALQPRASEAPALPLERWRLAGGAVRIAAVNITKGNLKAGASGELQLDELHRAVGRLDTSVEGADAFLPRLGLPSTALAFLKLSGGKLRLPVTLINGRMAVGPVSVARLIPLY
ncbi:MAG: DUF2125 domain-containing protein [Hyphomicrobiales bacterium]|nr:DUF2125 domain-containing protein [Hyphomicrobiales bacterium]